MMFKIVRFRIKDSLKDDIFDIKQENKIEKYDFLSVMLCLCDGFFEELKEERGSKKSYYINMFFISNWKVLGLVFVKNQDFF